MKYTLIYLPIVLLHIGCNTLTNEEIMRENNLYKQYLVNESKYIDKEYEKLEKLKEKLEIKEEYLNRKIEKYNKKIENKERMTIRIEEQIKKNIEKQYFFKYPRIENSFEIAYHSGQYVVPLGKENSEFYKFEMGLFKNNEPIGNNANVKYDKFFQSFNVNFYDERNKYTGYQFKRKHLTSKTHYIFNYNGAIYELRTTKNGFLE
jgi:hypothetical protein